ncbi:hypothetical protein PHLCEN_2v13704 [Hermanssonia centrifuga]|uniref:Uncharacterized protein n=1 Tax=Hermanssonia centrifuga TaxID=98765 RepID=A0A2R6NDM8_9APHY|nr:hypothetical protein PHLCEN_2v13704 [Hermanssonia centrifuga]
MSLPESLASGVRDSPGLFHNKTYRGEQSQRFVEDTSAEKNEWDTIIKSVCGSNTL